MGEVIELSVITKLDIPVEKILNAALAHQLDKVVIVGADENGDLYFAASVADPMVTSWLLTVAQKKLLEYSDV